MAREKFQTLTEQMFYVLLCLREECCGMDLMERIRLLTSGRVSVGPGTLYNLLEQFAAEGYIVETKCEGRRRSYVLTEKGEERLHGEMKSRGAACCFLEVRSRNSAAIALYEKAGYEYISTRRNYYPDDDAAIYRIAL